MAYTLSQLAKHVGGITKGNADCLIDRVAPIQDSGKGAISFLYSDRYQKYLTETRAEAVILTEALSIDSPVPVIVVKNPRAAYAKIASLLYPPFKPEAGVHASAVIDASAQIADSACVMANVVIEPGAKVGSGSYIGPGCVIGRDSIIGDDVYLHANVTVYYDCQIGNNTIIHSGSVIGADGFGFEFDEGQWLKVPQVGGVRIGQNVEIGACTTVDRGALYHTVIEDGVKLDNHVQIAHNVQVGAHTIMSNGVGIAGSTKIGRNCIFGGMTGVRDNIEITDNVMVNAMSMVSKTLDKPGSYSSGLPVDDTPTWRKNTARFRQLDDIVRKVLKIEKKINKE